MICGRDMARFMKWQPSWTTSWILKMPRGENQSTRRILELHDTDYWKMQRTDCYQTLQGSAKKLVSATGLLKLLSGTRSLARLYSLFVWWLSVFVCFYHRMSFVPWHWRSVFRALLFLTVGYFSHAALWRNKEYIKVNLTSSWCWKIVDQLQTHASWNNCNITGWTVVQALC